MKFGEELLSQMVPEWQQFYVKYESLKITLEVIKLTNTDTPTLDGAKNHHGGGLNRIMTQCSTFSGLSTTPGKQRRGGYSHDVEGGLQMTRPVFTTKSRVVEEEGGENENKNKNKKLFMDQRDDEFKKVSKFYKEKVDKALDDAEMLKGKMDNLINFRSKVEKGLKKFGSSVDKGMKPWDGFRGWEEFAKEFTLLASDIVTAARDISDSTPAIAKSVRSRSQAYMEITEEGESSQTRELEDDDDEEEGSGARGSVGEVSTRRVKTARPAPAHVHDGVVASNDTTENRKKYERTLKKYERELKKYEHKLSEAFVDFYQKLLLLKSYSFMNVKAFSKIMKKYDKITSSDERMEFMKTVDTSYLGSSNDVEGLIVSVENLFVKHIAKSNRTNGMNILRPKVLRERHRLTFSTGFSAGCLFSLIVALATIIRTKNILQEAGQVLYMNTMFPLYSFFGFIVLHIIMYAVNIYYWRRYKINYSFIFQFKKGTELGYKQVLFLAFTTGVFALLCVLANLDMEIDPVTKDYPLFTELLPLFLLVGMFFVIIMPCKIFYHENRRFFLTCLYHCLAAPLFKVTFPDFFLGDQLTSQVQALRSLEFYICYYGWGDFRRRKNTCANSGAYNGFFFIVAVIPYFSRLLQCLRRLFEEGKTEQGWNGLKYFLTIVAVCFRTACSIQQGQILWRILAIITSVVAAIFGTYWDFVHDWGLLNRKSTNPWLRNKLLIPQKKVYVIAMILNVLLRFAWIETVLDFKIPFMHKQTRITVAASLEIIRRGIWNFFRLENEQLNNAEKYRDFKSVPQASNYDEKKND